MTIQLIPESYRSVSYLAIPIYDRAMLAEFTH